MLRDLRRWAKKNGLFSLIWGKIRWYSRPEGYEQISNKFKYIGGTVQCPICGWRGREFYPYGVVERPNALCPRCNAVERHRLLHLYLNEISPGIMHQRKVLEIAPGAYSKILYHDSFRYVSCDLYLDQVDLRADILKLPFADNGFDLVVCYHVLEHIADDLQALREIFRVLAPEGFALLQVPIDRERTLEVDGITTSEQRLQLFGQADHVRSYGHDFKDRVESIGFSCSVNKPAKYLAVERIRKNAIDIDERIYQCLKPNLGTK